MIELNREAFAKALEPCARVADPKSTLPALAHVLLVVDGGKLSYRASNLRHEISGSVEATGDGSFCLNAKDLLGAVTALDGETIKLTREKDAVTVKASGKRSFKLQCLDAVEFPSPMNIGGDTVSLPAGVLQNCIRRLTFAARQENDRAEQNVIRFDHVEGKLCAAATNGQAMMAILRTELDTKLALSIPLETTRLISGYDGEVEVTTGGNAMAFQLGSVRVSAAEPVGIFPPVYSADGVQAAAASRVVIDAAKLLDSVKAVRRAADDVRLLFNGSSIVIKADGATSATDEVEVDGDSHTVEVWLPGDQLTGALSIPDGDVTIGIGRDQLDVLRLTAGDWACWIMPMRPDTVKPKKK